MPNIGNLASDNSLIELIAYLHASGSPGPFERKIPSGLLFRISFAGVVAGRTVMSQPRE